ncbi:MAG TPA: hypothetical protein VGQ33_10395 [Vicinamibacteria bacterium]|nr:hypothetical protein [Vicinamibacteria bacterium]
MISFWFPVPGHLGIGVTAQSLAEATEMATSVAVGQGWTLDARLVEQNVQLGPLGLEEALDTGRPGVWFPVLTPGN